MSIFKKAFLTAVCTAKQLSEFKLIITMQVIRNFLMGQCAANPVSSSCLLFPTGDFSEPGWTAYQFGTRSPCH